ncbi:MAG TPA: TolC family protein [Bryobacteraceae bacterium]|jgi:outer membrane protein TolC
MHTSRLLSLVLIAALSGLAQSPEVSIETPEPPRWVGPILKPFHLEKRRVSPAKLEDSPRLESLVRAGNLYLTAQDVIALALENNLDIALQRYGPFLAREALRRTEAGNLLRTVDTPILQGPQSVSTAGISSTGLAGGAGVAAVGTVLAQVGAPLPNLDPVLSAQVQVGHQTSPETDTILVGTQSLANATRYYSFSYSQQFITNTSIYASYYSNRSFVNSPYYVLNPSTSGQASLSVTQPLLQGFSPSVNSRYIKVARNNLKSTDLQMKMQVITTISAVLDLYWDLVSFNDDVRLKQQALDLAQKLYDDNRAQVQLGTLPQIEVTRAAAEVSARREDLVQSQTHVAQQETVLKNTLSRDSASNAWLDDVHIIPLDQIEVPKTEDLKSVNELIAQALTERPELQQSNINLASAKITESGERNGLLPSLSAFASLANNGLAGTPVCVSPCSYPSGGEGTILLQELRRNYPNYSAGFSLSIPFRNRVAQADYVADELQLRQTELRLKRAENEVRVDVKNAVMGLQQARSRYESAVATRVLAQETLEAEQNRFNFGQVPDTTLVIQAQKEVVQDQTDEVQAMANYTHARIAFDFAVGQTLDVNHVSMDEAISGSVARESVLPAVLPGQKGVAR